MKKKCVESWKRNHEGKSILEGRSVEAQSANRTWHRAVQLLCWQGANTHRVADGTYRRAAARWGKGRMVIPRNRRQSSRREIHLFLFLAERLCIIILNIQTSSTSANISTSWRTGATAARLHSRRGATATPAHDASRRAATRTPKAHLHHPRPSQVRTFALHLFDFFNIF
jgi:hypothetical protein